MVSYFSFPTGKMKEKSGPSIDKNTGSKSDAKKYGLNGNRYNVLDDIDEYVDSRIIKMFCSFI